MNIDTTSKPITARRTFAHVDTWIEPHRSAMGRLLPQWIGDRIRTIAIKRDENTVSDKMMMLRNLVAEPMLCRWDVEAEREGSDKPGAWIPSKTLAVADAEFARMSFEQRPLNRAMRRQIFRGRLDVQAPPLLDQSESAVAKRKKVRRLERCWRKVDKRRGAK